MGVFSIFGISARAVNAYSGALNVISNNVANAANEDYSRQKVSFSALSPDSIGGIEFGRGLFLSDVSQVVDTFVENRLTESKQKEGAANARHEFIQGADAIFSEFEGTGLNSAMSGFFDAWSGLAADPSSISVRNNVLAAADNMINIYQQYSDSMTVLRNTINDEIESITPVVNTLLTEIKDLNEDIRQSPTQALNLQDQRRKAVNELASYIDVNVVETGDTIQVYTKSGTPLVNGDNTAILSTVPNAGNDNMLDIVYSLGDTTTTLTSSIQSGRLHGLLDVRDNYISSYKDELDNSAYTMVTQVNALHSAGFDLGGANGNLFFGALATSTDAAAQISLHANVDNLPSEIAASSLAAEVPGNNIQALAIAALAESNSIDFDPTAGTDNNSFFGHFGDLLSTIGTDGMIAESDVSFQGSILNQVMLERSEASGVNMDEEEINLIKFQAAFQAATRLVKMADELLAGLLETL
ncbi:flagellar hook-associated protein FlgK [bacterium K02(2017)]|nr:flagellar hook-associated protein FlgK [bacterium K02(2017)]